MAEPSSASNENEISRDRLPGPFKEKFFLGNHAKQELDHALTISRQIDYLGKMPAVAPKPVRTSKDAKEMLRFDLENENETVRNYRDRIRQCEALGEFAMAEQIRQILMQEQDHQIDLATALGVEVPDLSAGPPT